MTVPKGRERTLLIHNAVDSTLLFERNLKDEKPISCKKGCNHCCHQLVWATEDEADLLYSLFKASPNFTNPKVLFYHEL